EGSAPSGEGAAVTLRSWVVMDSFGQSANGGGTADTSVAEPCILRCGRVKPELRPHASDAHGQQISVSSTATCAIAALSVPIPSGVFALMPTHEGSILSNSATFC